MSALRKSLTAGLLVAGMAATPALASGYGVGMYFADAAGKIKPTLFSEPGNLMDLAVCKARLEYLTKKFYRMVRKNMHEFDGMKLVKSECAKVDTFDYGSN
jgi:hypothetical protein